MITIPAGLLLVSLAAPERAAAASAPAVDCVVSAWNAYDADRARRCYAVSAVARHGAERVPIDWELERAYRGFDQAARSQFRVEVLASRPPAVEFALHERNDLLAALGVEQATARWRYVVRDGLIVEEELLQGDDAFARALRDLVAWAPVHKPEAWAWVTGPQGQPRFDGNSASILVTLAGDWKRATSASGESPETRLIGQLSAQSDRWDKAIVRKDRAAIEANMADDFRQIDRAGNVETKKSFVDGLMSPDLEIDPYTVEDFDVRLYGDTALLCGRTRMTGRYQGKPFRSHYRYIDVYVRRNEAWQIVSVQISPIPEAAAQ